MLLLLHTHTYTGYYGLVYSQIFVVLFPSLLKSGQPIPPISRPRDSRLTYHIPVGVGSVPSPPPQREFRERERDVNAKHFQADALIKHANFPNTASHGTYTAHISVGHTEPERERKARNPNPKNEPADKFLFLPLPPRTQLRRGLVAEGVG